MNQKPNTNKKVLHIPVEFLAIAMLVGALLMGGVMETERIEHAYGEYMK